MSATLVAQPLDRLTGFVRTDAGAAFHAADVRVEALFGFAGGDFLGQRTFDARADQKGRWALIAFKAGIWIFEASAPDCLPDVVALPYHLVSPPGSALANVDPTWHPVLRPTKRPDGEIGALLAEAAEAARARRDDRVAPLLARVSNSSNADVLEAAGRICLLMRDATVARPLFRRALERDPASFRAMLGMGSSALMQRDTDSAAKAFADARALTKDKDDRGYLAVAVNELNKAHNVMKGTY